MPQNNNVVGDIELSAEEVLGPPKVDMMGLFMMFLLALVVGFVSSMSIVLISFLTMGKFSLESGVTPMLLSMITFFALVVADMIYLWGAKTIFPHIYRGTRTVFMHISVFCILLYISVLPLYMMSPSGMTEKSIGILIAYIFHILLNIFGLEIIMSALSGFRYLLLSLYASITGLVLSSAFMFFAYQKIETTSTTSLFVLLGFGSISFVITVMVVFIIKFLYYRYYILSGSDTIGDTFARIQEEEKNLEKTAEQQLLGK